MHNRRLVSLHARSLRELPFGCEVCGAGTDTPGWALAAEQRWGLCGVAVRENDRVVASLVMTPALNLPDDHVLAHRSRTPSSAVLVGLHVASEFRGAGMAKLLVRSAAARLVNRADCLEAAGAAVSVSCQIAPAGWLRAVGFQLCTDEVLLPFAAQRYRLDLASTVRWQPDMSRAWGFLTGLTSRPVSPPGTSREGSSGPSFPLSRTWLS